MQDTPPDRPAAWLYRVARNLAGKQRVGDQRRKRREAERAVPEAFHPEPSARLEQGEALAAVMRLEDPLREVLVARLWGEMTLVETGELCGISAATAMRRYEAALAKFARSWNHARTNPIERSTAREHCARQLADSPPRLEQADRDTLVYQCGFAAGRRAAMRGVRRWSVAAACLAIMAGGIGLMATARREPPEVRQVVGNNEVTAQAEAVRPTTQAAGRDDDSRRPGMLLAGASWEQVRTATEAPADRSGAIAAPDTKPRRQALRAGSMFFDLDLSQ